MVNLLHQGQQAANLPLRETLTGKPVEIVARQVSYQRSLVLAEGHFAGYKQLNIGGIQYSSPSLLPRRLALRFTHDSQWHSHFC